MKRFSVYLKILLVCIILSVVLFAVFGIFVGVSNTPTAETPQNIPYYATDAPEEYGMLINFSVGGSVFLEFSRISEKTAVLLLENNAKTDEITVRGYEVDMVFSANYDFLASLIDRFGGIELNTETDGRLNFTGVQITEMLSKSTDAEFRRRIIKRLIENINRQGVNTSDMLFLIENTESELNYPSAYLLPETISAASEQIIFIN